jgi:uncharacterized protein
MHKVRVLGSHAMTVTTSPKASQAETPCLRRLGNLLLLLLLSAALVGGLLLIHMPAAMLLGAILAALVMALANWRVPLSSRAFGAAQAVMGVLIARAFPPQVFLEIGTHWEVFLGGVVSVVVAAVMLGCLLMRWKVLPGSSPIWGSFPGAATAMTVMAEDFGADMRLVAFMQYTRVIMVALVAALVSMLFMPPGGEEVASPMAALADEFFAPVSLGALGKTVLVMVGSTVLGRLLRLPAAPMLATLVVSTVLQALGWLQIELPMALLAAAYLVIGWNIGLRFNREIVRHVARALPRVLLSIASLIGLCGLMAAALVHWLHLDPLTAYLATSPGGADSVAIIATSTHVDAPFVMAMQTARFLFVLLVGPPIARWVASIAVPVNERPVPARPSSARRCG